MCRLAGWIMFSPAFLFVLKISRPPAAGSAAASSIPAISRPPAAGSAAQSPGHWQPDLRQHPQYRPVSRPSAAGSAAASSIPASLPATGRRICSSILNTGQSPGHRPPDLRQHPQYRPVSRPPAARSAAGSPLPPVSRPPVHLKQLVFMQKVLSGTHWYTFGTLESLIIHFCCSFSSKEKPRRAYISKSPGSGISRTRTYDPHDVNVVL